jgi:hypothetical protein
MDVGGLREVIQNTANHCGEAHGRFAAAADQAGPALANLPGIIERLTSSVPELEPVATALAALAANLNEGSWFVDVAVSGSAAIGNSNNPGIAEGQQAIAEMNTANLEQQSRESYDASAKAAEYLMAILTATYGLQEIQDKTSAVSATAERMRDVAANAAQKMQAGASQL